MIPLACLRNDFRCRAKLGGVFADVCSDSITKSREVEDSHGRQEWHSQDQLRSPAVNVMPPTTRKKSCGDIGRSLIVMEAQDQTLPSLMANKQAAPTFHRARSRRRPTREVD